MTDSITNSNNNFMPENNVQANDDTANLPLTSDDMLVHLFADENKLISENRRWNYDANASKSELPAIHENNLYDNNAEGDNKNVDQQEHFTGTQNEMHNDTPINDNNENNYQNQYSDKNVSDNEHFNNNAQQNTNAQYAEQPRETEQEIHLKKLAMLTKLVDLANSGVKLSKNYNLNSDLKMMEYEYNMHRNIRAKHNGINLMSSMTLNMVRMLEMGNKYYDPFSLKLDKWSDQMNADASNYYDVFGELYNYHMKDGKPMDPHLKFMLMISGSALKVHMGHMAAGMIPNMSEGFAKNPELEQKLRDQAAAETIKKQHETANKFNEKLNGEHNAASKNASDLQMLREKELEYLDKQRKNNNAQPTMAPPSMTQPTMAPPSMTQNNDNNMHPNKNISPEEFELFKKQSLINQHNHLVQMKRQQMQQQMQQQKYDNMNSATDKSLDNYLIKELESSSNASTSSKLSINPNIDEIINTTQKKIKNNAQYKMESVNKDDIDVISFGNKSKGTGSKGSTKSKGSNKSKKGINMMIN